MGDRQGMLGKREIVISTGVINQIAHVDMFVLTLLTLTKYTAEGMACHLMQLELPIS